MCGAPQQLHVGTAVAIKMEPLEPCAQRASTKLQQPIEEAHLCREEGPSGCRQQRHTAYQKYSSLQIREVQEGTRKVENDLAYVFQCYLRADLTLTALTIISLRTDKRARLPMKL